MGLSVYIMALIVAQSSGGHINPAVSIALFIVECKRNFWGNFGTLLLYITAQVFGAVLGLMVSLVGIGLESIEEIRSVEDRVRF